MCKTVSAFVNENNIITSLCGHVVRARFQCHTLLLLLLFSCLPSASQNSVPPKGLLKIASLRYWSVCRSYRFFAGERRSARNFRKNNNIGQCKNVETDVFSCRWNFITEPLGGNDRAAGRKRYVTCVGVLVTTTAKGRAGNCAVKTKANGFAEQPSLVVAHGESNERAPSADFSKEHRGAPLALLLLFCRGERDERKHYYTLLLLPRRERGSFQL